VALIWSLFLGLSFVCCFANRSKPASAPRVRWGTLFYLTIVLVLCGDFVFYVTIVLFCVTSVLHLRPVPVERLVRFENSLSYFYELPIVLYKDEPPPFSPFCILA
jgi:hypothetical protein